MTCLSKYRNNNKENLRNILQKSVSKNLKLKPLTCPKCST